MAVPFSQNRRGMVYLDDSSSGEFAAPGQHSSTSYASTDIATHRPSDSPRNDRAAGSEDSYDEIYSSSDEDSYHSDCDDIAEYWDPYCEAHQLASDHVWLCHDQPFPLQCTSSNCRHPNQAAFHV